MDVFIRMKTSLWRMYPSIPSWQKLYHKQLFYQMLWNCEVSPHWSITLINFLILSQSSITSVIPIGLDIVRVLCVAEFSLLIFCLAFLTSLLMSGTYNLLSGVVPFCIGINVILDLQNWLRVLLWTCSICFCSVPWRLWGFVSFSSNWKDLP